MKKVYKDYKVLVHSNENLEDEGMTRGSVILNTTEKTFVIVTNKGVKRTKKNPVIFDGGVVRVRKTLEGFRFTIVLKKERCKSDSKLKSFAQTMLNDLNHVFEIIPDVK